jgi:ATP-binding cassette subfamily B protein
MADVAPARGDTVRRVIACFGPHRGKVAAIAASLLVTSSIGLVNPMIVRAIIDRAIPAHDLRLLATLAAAMVAATLGGGLLDTGETYLTTVVGQRVMLELRLRLYRHLQRMSLRFFTESRAGEILSRVTADVNGVQELVTTTAAEIMNNLIVVVTALALMLALDWKLTLVCLSMLPLFVYPTRKAGSIRRRLSKEAQAKIADLSTVLEETMSVSGALLVKTFGRQGREVERFSGTADQLMRLEIKRTMLGQLFWLSIQTFWAAAPALIYLWGGRAVAHGTLSLGSVVAFVTLQNRMFFPIGRLFGVQVQIQGALAVFERIFEYLDLPVEIDDAP